jgi:hypothetical protein
MKQSPDIRVRTTPEYEALYRDLRPFCGEAHAVFFLCTCLGFQAGRKAPLEAKRAERFWSSTITPDEWACYYAIVAEESGLDFSLLGDDRRVISSVEAYADEGMRVLVEELLFGYLVRPGELRLDPSGSRELAWEVLKFIPDKLG